MPVLRAVLPLNVVTRNSEKSPVSSSWGRTCCPSKAAYVAK